MKLRCLVSEPSPSSRTAEPLARGSSARLCDAAQTAVLLQPTDMVVSWKVTRRWEGSRDSSTDGAAAEGQSLRSRPGVPARRQGAATGGCVVGALVQLTRRPCGGNRCHARHELRSARLLSAERRTEHSTANRRSSPRGENPPHEKPRKKAL